MDSHSKEIRWGILGTGAIAAHFAEGLASVPGATLQAIGSRARASADAFARAHGARRAYGSYEELARDPEVDVVYVATPNSAHRDNAILCIEAGKAVLCEKPFTVDAAEARQVVELARARDVFCMEGMWMRFVPLVRELSVLLRGGTIGDVRMITASLGMPFAFDAAHRVFDPLLGGGALLDLGVYPVSFAFYLLGRPTRVSSHAVLGATGVDEQATILLDFPEGRQAALTTSLRNTTSNDATVMGTDGMIRVAGPLYRPESLTVHRSSPAGGTHPVRSGIVARAGRLARLRQNPLVRDVRSLVARARAKTVTRRVLGNGYAHEAEEVMRCLRAGDRESPVMPLDETLAIMETMDAIRLDWSRAASRA